MNFIEEKVTKFAICQNCRNNYPDKLFINAGVADLLCTHCKGIDSNYDPLRREDRAALSGEGGKDA
jgi:hypothetical protein